jgi:flagellar biosynthesis GTPase FlhF
MKNLNDLKELQNLWNTIINLPELEKNFRQRLAEMELQNLDQLLEEINNTEEQIQKFQQQGRKGKVEEKVNYLRELQELKELWDNKINLSERSSTSQIKILDENKNNEKRVYGKDLQAKVDTLTLCAEETAIEFLTDFEQRSVGDQVFSLEEDTMNSMLEDLQVQIQCQNLILEDIRTRLQNFQMGLKSSNRSSTPPFLREISRKIKPLNVREIQSLVAKAKEAARVISNKDIVLLIGETGSGKSTTIQFLAGSKMKKNSSRSFSWT